MLELNNAGLPEEAIPKKDGIAFAIDGHFGDAFTTDPLGVLKLVSNPFTLPTVLNPDYIAIGYLYKIPKVTTTEMFANGGRQTNDYFYLITNERKTIEVAIKSSYFTFPIYTADSYGFDISDAGISGATVSRVDIAGNNVIPTQNGDVITIHQQYEALSNVTIYGSVVLDVEPYAIVHKMNYTESFINSLVEVNHLTRTYTRVNESTDVSHYNFTWENPVATLFLPMEWEFTLKPPARIGSTTIGLITF